MFLLQFLGQVLKNAALFIIRAYQVIISPLLGAHCRFHPTCSNYAIEAFEKKSFFMGLYLTTSRIIRCNPLSRGGEDRVA